MADMKLFLELLLKNSTFRSELNNSRGEVTRFTQGAKREFDALRGSVTSIQGVLAGLGISIGVMQNQMASARLDKGLTQLKQTAGESADKMKTLRQEFFLMGRETGRDVEKIKNGFDSLIQSGLSWKASRETAGGVNIATAVTGADEATLARGLTVGATAFKMDLEKPGKALELLDKMTVAGRLGNAELENLSDIFSRVGVNAAEAGFKFEKTLGFIEALSMAERNPERLATLADSTLRVFNNLQYMSAAQKGTGVRFFAADGSRRDPVAVLEDIRKKYSALKTDAQRANFVQAAFGKMDLDTIKGMRTLLSGNSLQQISSFTRQIEQGGGTLKKDLPEAVSNAADQVGRLKSALRQAGDEFAQPINRAVSDAIKYLLDQKQLSGGEIIGLGAGAVAGGALMYRYGGKMLKGLVGGAAGTAVGVAEGKALEKMAGVTPVFVTNWPGGATPGVPAVVPTSAKALPWLATAGGSALVAATAGVPISMAISNAQRANGWGSQTWRRGSAEYDVMGISAARRSAFAAPQVKNEIKLQVTIDKNGRVIAVGNDLNTNINTTVRRGSFDDALLRSGL